MVRKYQAAKGKVFDWKEPHYIEVDGNEVQEHLRAKVIFLGITDSIDNYIEVDE